MSEFAVPRESLLSLVACAQAGASFPEIGLEDPWAERLAARLEVDARGFPDLVLRAAAVRAAAFDDIVRDFLRRRPGGVVLSLHPGFCTRFSRVDDGSVRFVDLDPRPIAEAKALLMVTPDRHMVASCCSLSCPGWMHLLQHAPDVPFLVLSEGALVREGPDVADAFLTSASRWAPAGAELVLDHDTRLPLGPGFVAGRRSAFELAGPDGATRYPRLRRVDPVTYPPALRQRLSGTVSAAGRQASIVHLRFV